MCLNFSYLENFLGFPVGGIVPVGYFDRNQAVWMPSPDGRVVQVLDIAGGIATLDVDGTGIAATATALTALGITTDELTQLAQLYQPGQSLWRVSVTHFSSWDFNWPWGPPPGALPYSGPDPDTGNNPPVDNPNPECGSVIGCEDQSLGEALPVAGTPWELNYRSNRTPSYNNSLDITLSGATLPPNLKRIDLEVMVAGQQWVVHGSGAVPNLHYMLNPGVFDAYGRLIIGTQPTDVRISYVYSGVYLTPPQQAAGNAANAAFGHMTYLGTAVSANTQRFEISLDKNYTSQTGAKVGTWDNRAFGLGGWSLDVHHAYDPVSKTLVLGNGQQRRADANWSHVITTVAGISGNGSTGFSGDGGPATAAQVSAQGIAFGPDGSLYIADANNHRIRRVGPDGIITTVAGNGVAGFSGDGAQATAAQLSAPASVAVGSDGSLYIADTNNACIRRVGSDGIITTVAGNGVAGFSGDGAQATSAQLSAPASVAVGPDGVLYIADTKNNRIRRVGADGIITTVVGTWAGYSWDGYVKAPTSIALGPDGSLYIVEYGFNIVSRVGPDGGYTRVAGGDGCSIDLDGKAAAGASLCPSSIAIGPDSSMYIAESYFGWVRYVGLNGILTTSAGTGVRFFGYGNNGDGGPATAAPLGQITSVAVGPDGYLYIATGFGVRRVAPALPGLSASDILVPSEDGSELYIFNRSGRHLRTLEALTGSLRYQFGYSTDGYLITVTDASGNVTSIERTGATPSAIVAPGGQRTTLTVDANGWLTTATNPASETHVMSYSVDGSLQTFADPRGNVHRFTYAQGLLIKDENPAGGSTSLVRTKLSDGNNVTTSTALGRTHSYQVEKLLNGAILRTVTDSSGAATVTQSNSDGSEQTTFADGNSITAAYGPDPRFGMLAPHITSRVRSAPDGLTETLTSTSSATFAGTGLSLQTLTDTTTVNGRTFTSNYDATTRTITDTSAEGRQSVTVLDAQGRVVSRSTDPSVAPITLVYDSQGRVSRQQQATQRWTYTYDTLNRVASRTDAAGLSDGFVYDNADRVIQRILPDGKSYHFTYDANGNRTQVVLPSGASHALGYTPINLDASYTPPNNGSYVKSFNVDRELESITLPGGRTTTQGYDALDRVSGLTYPEGVIGFQYQANDLTDRVGLISNTPAPGFGPEQNIAYAYNGQLITGMTATGVAPAQVAYTYDNNFFPTAMNLSSGADTLSSPVAWNNDGQITAFGPFTFTRSGPAGALSQISDGTATTNYGYDTLARLVTRNHLVSAQATYSMQLSYDNSGRITGKTEVVNGVSHAYAYAYDPNGQLTEVNRDGAPLELFAYDANGNRISHQLGSSAAETATYDIQDRLVQRGSDVYQFNADGFLAQRGSDSFQYNTRGQLIGANAGGQAITFAYDGLGRRVSRTDAIGTSQYIYGDPASHLVTAVRAPNSVLTSLYYDTSGLLISMQRGGVTYYVATDQVGSPRVITDSTGAVVKTVDYDSFGSVIADSNPTFDLPIGYAGGLADAATGLVHFSFRDYEPASGRWTARDPVLFEAGQGNLYVYVGNSPIGYRDPSGLLCVSVSVYEGLGGGVQTCIDGNGASVCAEVGVGVGASAGLDSGRPEQTGAQIVSEASVQWGNAKLKAGLQYSNGCGVKKKANFQFGNDEWTANAESGKIGVKVKIPDAPKIAGAAKAEAKLAAKVCYHGSF